ncbi:PspA/IM30 family protein [candidate division KSB1 bacterium]|nr:PspA/IM30 family protein [candidate division KSB1 bacterium]
MGILNRLFKIGQSEAHALVDKLEDPIKLTEQGIRDLKKDLEASLTSLAEVKAIAIRMRKDAENNKLQSQEYERKAMLLLQKAQSGQISQGEADRLATEAIVKKDEHDKAALHSEKEYQKQQAMVDKLQNNINRLKSTISTYDNELITLKARAKTASSVKKINKQLANIDSSGTIHMLEKMKTKVDEEESLASAYGEIAGTTKTLDDEIDTVLADSKKVEAGDKLAALKARLAAGPQAGA